MIIMVLIIVNNNISFICRTLGKFKSRTFRSKTVFTKCTEVKTEDDIVLLQLSVQCLLRVCVQMCNKNVQNVLKQ